MIGKTISHYRILEKLGEGGMGVVYKAEDTKLGRHVVLKFLAPYLTRDPQAIERFINEAKAASALDHPNLCTIYEIGESEDGQLFIAMAYYEGETLREKIVGANGVRANVGADGRPPVHLSVSNVIEIATQIASGLARAHEAGIIHRDIKPANIIITKRNEVKIVDFGLAKLAGQQHPTRSGATMGTIAYMSPEQAQGLPADQRADIWSLGVVMYEMLTGQLLFKGEYDQAVMYAIVNTMPKPIRALRSDVPIELEQIVNFATSKKIGSRYQAALDMLSELRKLKPESGKKAQTTSVLKKSSTAKRKFLFLGAALSVALILWLFLRFLVINHKAPISASKMLMVLPFENIGPTEHEYFADGITEEIMSRLAGIQELRVIARKTSIQYKGSKKDIKQIGKELNVDYILEGTVRWEKLPLGSSRVRVTPQLIRVSDETQIWSDRYDEALAEIFQVQSSVAERVANALNIRLLESENFSLKIKPTQNLEAYDFFLQGIAYGRKADFETAQKMYEKAIELDPRFALAYATLSVFHTQMFWYYRDRTQERLNKAKAAVDTALNLQPELPEAHLALGIYYYQGLLDYDRAMQEFVIVKQRQPNNADVWAWIGYIHRRRGQFQQTVINLKKAVELDPLSFDEIENLAWTYRVMHDYQEAIHYFDRAIVLRPDRFDYYLDKALIYISWTGDKTELVGREIRLTRGRFYSQEWRINPFDGGFDELFHGANGGYLEFCMTITQHCGYCLH